MESNRDLITFEAKNPRHRGVISGATIVERRANPSCGDVVTMYAELDGEMIKTIKFEGVGCVISMASASMTSNALAGKRIDEVLGLANEDIARLTGIEVGPMRENCLMLGVDALKRGITLWKQV